MFFLPVEFDRESTLSECGLNNENPLVCRLAFNGDTSGSLTIMAPKILVAEMAENFMGEAKGLLTEEHFSGTLAEMLNMVCGNALSKTETKVPFELGIPEVIDEPDIQDTERLTIVETTESKMAFFLQIN